VEIVVVKKFFKNVVISASMFCKKCLSQMFCCELLMPNDEAIQFCMFGESCVSRFEISGKSLKKIFISTNSNQISVQNSIMTKNNITVIARLRGQPIDSILLQTGYIIKAIKSPNNNGTNNALPR
jgi:hypothetical protein